MWEDMIISCEATNGHIYESMQAPCMDDESKKINKWDSKVACEIWKKNMYGVLKGHKTKSTP